MVVKKRLFGLFLMVILLSGVAHSQNPILVAENGVKDKIFSTETAVFELSILNNQAFQDSFRFSILDIGWDFEANPGRPIINQGETKEIEISLTPTSDQGPGRYGITLMIYSVADASIFSEQVFYVDIIDFYDVVSTSLDLPNDVNPQKQMLVKLNLENKGDIVFNDLLIKLSSEFFEIEKTVDLNPYETKVEEFLVDFKGLVNDGTYDIVLEIYDDENLLIERIEDMLIGYYPEVNELRTPESGFLKDSILITKTNSGTSTSHEIYTKRFSLFERLFTSTEPEPNAMFKDGTYYTLQWEFDLSPNETKEIFIETNYRAFVFLSLIFLILLFYLYNRYKIDIELDKKVVTMKHSKEGISTINILLVLKNKSGKTLKNLKVMDNMVNVAEKPTNFGTIQPSVIRKGITGTKMVWNIESLEKGAEVIISYQAKCKVHVIGHINIPSAVAKYIKSGRSIIVKSNKVKLFS